MSLNMIVTVPSGAGWMRDLGAFALDGAGDAVDRGVDAAGGDALQFELEGERAFEVALHAQLFERSASAAPTSSRARAASPVAPRAFSVSA